MSKQKWIDLAERSAWTLLEAGVGAEVVAQFDLPVLVGVAVAGALAGVKASLAQKFGNGTGATVPVEHEAVFLPRK